MLPIRYSRPSITLFDEFFKDDFFKFPFWEISSEITPTHDIIENEKEFLVEFELAGVKKEDVSIDVERNILTISAERKEVKDLKYNRKESFTGKYQKSFTLPDTVDADNISASLNDGILTINIPKLEEPAKLSKKQIAIN